MYSPLYLSVCVGNICIEDIHARPQVFNVYMYSPLYLSVCIGNICIEDVHARPQIFNVYIHSPLYLSVCAGNRCIEDIHIKHVKSVLLHLIVCHTQFHDIQQNVEALTLHIHSLPIPSNIRVQWKESKIYSNTWVNTYNLHTL